MTTATEKKEVKKESAPALGAIWETVKESKTYLTGEIMGQKVVLVLNPKRDEDKQAKYLVYPLIDKTKSNAPSSEKIDEAPAPVEKETGIGDDLSMTGTIKSVRKDKKGFCIDATWFKVDDNTELSGLSMDNARGKEVTVHYIPATPGLTNANPVAVSVAA